MKNLFKVFLWSMAVTTVVMVVALIVSNEITRVCIQLSYFQLGLSILAVQFVSTLVLMRMIRL